MRSRGPRPEASFLCASGPYQDEISLVIRHMPQQQGARFICAPGRIRISPRWVAPGAVSGVDAHRGVHRKPAPLRPLPHRASSMAACSMAACRRFPCRPRTATSFGSGLTTYTGTIGKLRHGAAGAHRRRVDARRKGQSAEVDSADRKSRPGPRPVRRLPAGTRRGARFDPRNLRRAAPRNRYQMRGEQVELLASRRPGAEEIDAYEQVLGDAMAATGRCSRVKTTSRKPGASSIPCCRRIRRCTAIRPACGDRAKSTCRWRRRTAGRTRS